jgi:hypothetical protein
MSKTKSKKKRQAQAALVGQPTKIQKLQPTIQVQAVATPDDVTAIAPKALQSVIHDDDLEITVDTLSTLSKYPNLIKSKACKDLRVAVYDFRQASTVGMDTTSMNPPHNCIRRDLHEY